MKKALIESIRNQLKIRGLQHVQFLLTMVDGKLCIKFTSVDTDAYKTRVKELTDDYRESLALVKETKTTLVYVI